MPSRLLFVQYQYDGSTIGLYGDDGEIRCNACGCDFVRNTATQFERKIYKYRMAQLVKDGLTTEIKNSSVQSIALNSGGLMKHNWVTVFDTTPNYLAIVCPTCGANKDQSCGEVRANPNADLDATFKTNYWVEVYDRVHQSRLDKLEAKAK